MINKFKTRIIEKWYGFKTASLLQNISFFELLDVIKENKEKVKTAEADCNENWIYIYEDKACSIYNYQWNSAFDLCCINL